MSNVVVKRKLSIKKIMLALVIIITIIITITILYLTNYKRITNNTISNVNKELDSIINVSNNLNLNNDINHIKNAINKIDFKNMIIYNDKIILNDKRIEVANIEFMNNNYKINIYTSKLWYNTLKLKVTLNNQEYNYIFGNPSYLETTSNSYKITKNKKQLLLNENPK